jgi:hypothetical protein
VDRLLKLIDPKQELPNEDLSKLVSDYSRLTILAAQNREGKTVYTTEEISDTVDFYSEIYKPTTPEPPTFTLQHALHQSDWSEVQDITEETIEQLLKDLPKKSSPGPDGFSYTIWKTMPQSPLLFHKLFSALMDRASPP